MWLLLVPSLKRVVSSLPSFRPVQEDFLAIFYQMSLTVNHTDPVHGELIFHRIVDHVKSVDKYVPTAYWDKARVLAVCTVFWCSSLWLERFVKVLSPKSHWTASLLKPKPHVSTSSFLRRSRGAIFLTTSVGSLGATEIFVDDAMLVDIAWDFNTNSSFVFIRWIPRLRYQNR